MHDFEIEPRYATSKPDAPINLYEGKIRISWADSRFTGEGSITFVWQPFPQMRFDVRFDAVPNPSRPQSKVRLELLDTGGSVDGHPWSVQDDFGSGHLRQRIYGDTEGDLIIGNPASTDQVIFHVPNFPKYAGAPIQSARGHGTRAHRLTATTTEWIVDIDAVSDSTELNEQLSRQSGYGITHVGRVRRLDHKAITYPEAESVLDTLHWWLSLLRGERTGPMLIMGVHNDEAIWELWRVQIVAPWRGRHSWLPTLLGHSGVIDPNELGITLERLHQLKNDEDLGRIFAEAIDWYTQSVETPNVPTRVILAQAGLELMAWVQLVRTVGMTEDGFSKLTAADALRLTLSYANVSCEVPKEALELCAQCSNRDGGPAVITEIRNGAVHPKAVRRFSDMAMIEGGSLAIHFLELLLEL